MVPAHQGCEEDFAKAALVQYAVAFAFQEKIDDISARTRGPKGAALARQAAMYLTHVAFGMSLARVAAVFQRDRATVAHACQVTEDRRENPNFDACLDDLETFLRAAPSVVQESFA